ncbi:hypothetical protein [Sandaracinobacteroides hominis]|uniref:hypothetical protein n=1 Tax=Sandaracinobacteroides hominis TaxID=2780086 RepID=UPI0018F6C8C4|nr:hypothetical protein [Sandaracinobacteroides hominis]
MAATPLTATPAAQPSNAAAQAATAQPASRFVGSWEGTLEFRNIATGAQHKVPATMLGKLQPDGKALLDLTIDDGKGHIVRQPATIQLDAGSKRLFRNPGDTSIAFNVTGNMTPAATEPLALTLLGRGSEDGRPADIRETLNITGDTLVWGRETRIDGQDWRFRNEYRLTRKP